MARRLICALAALARAYDWTTPDAGLTPFNCTAFPNPIQVLLADGQKAPYNVSELDLAYDCGVRTVADPATDC